MAVDINVEPLRLFIKLDCEAAYALWQAEGVGPSMHGCWPAAFLAHRTSVEDAVLAWIRAHEFLIEDNVGPGFAHVAAAIESGDIYNYLNKEKN